MKLFKLFASFLVTGMNFDNPKVYGDTSIYDGLVCSEHIVTFLKKRPIFVLTEKDMFKQLKTRRSRKQLAKGEADRSASVDDECSKYSKGHQLFLCNKET